MRKIYQKLREKLSGLACLILLGGGSALHAQSTVLIPSTGSNTVTCGTNVLLQDHAGNSNYINNVNGFTVLDAGFGAVISIVGTYTTETNYDYIYIYNGAGTTGTIMGIYHGSGAINITGIAGQTITVRFYTDGSVVYQGFDLNVTYSGPCFATPCSGTPSGNAAVTPTFAICPGSSAGVGLASSYTVGGITYQWQASTSSSVGPYSTITGTNASISTGPLTQPTWYQAIITCTNSSQFVVSNAGLVMVQNTTTNTVPYFEGFEGIVKNNDLPNCSWLANPSLGSSAFTYTSANTQGRWARTGNNFASYYYTPTGAKTLYTNGVYLNAGVTYSAEVWYLTEYYGYTNWTDLSISVGPNQNQTGQVVVASTNGPAVASSYRQLSNTFQVTTSGLYYFGIKGTTNGSCCGYYLSLDDFAVTVPCQLNTPSLSISPSTSTLCAGDAINISAAGANSYSWSTGANGNSISDTPSDDMTYMVTGTNTLSGCSISLSHHVDVYPLPQVGVFASDFKICVGDKVYLTAFGAQSYIWSGNNSTNTTNTVSPSATETYTVYGTSALGCQGEATQMIIVDPLPTVIGSSYPSALICEGESVILSAAGANNYTWISSDSYLVGNNVNARPKSSTTYTVMGTDANGCVGVNYVTVGVNICEGVASYGSIDGLKVYPNPNSGVFNVDLGSAVASTTEITDMTGRVIARSENNAQVVIINIENLASGVYYTRVETASGVQVIRVIKQ